MGWYPESEAARFLGISTSCLRSRGQRGAHPRKKHGAGWVYKVTDDDRRAASRSYVVASIWDVHVPEHDEGALNAFLAWLRGNRVDELILGGDFLELASCSMHGGQAELVSFADEIDAGCRWLARIRDAFPDGRLVYLEGNHEDRLRRTTVAKFREMSGVVSLPEVLRLAEFDCEWWPLNETYRVHLPSGETGKLHYIHGKFCNKHHACKHLDHYGVSVRYGHTHRPQSYSRAYADGTKRIAIGSPCLRTLDPEWVKMQEAGWLHGFGLDEYMPDGTFTARNVLMTNRRFALGGTIYG